MNEHKQAFTQGVYRYCKAAGYDAADSEKLASLLLMPEVPGAQIAAKMVLDTREQQVKQAGEYLCKRAQDGAPTEGAWAPQNLLAKEQSDAAEGFAQRQAPQATVYVTNEFVNTYGMPSETGKTFQIVPTLEEAIQKNEASGNSQYNGVLNSVPKAPTTGTPTQNATAEAETTAAAEAAGEQPATDMGTTVEPDATVNPADAPDALAKSRTAGNPNAGSDYLSNLASQEGITPEMLQALKRHSDRRDTLKHLFHRAGVRLRPRQIAAASRRLTEGGKSTLEGGLGEFVNYARDVTSEQRKLNEELVGKRESAGHMYSGLRSGNYAPRAARGRQGRAVLTGRGGQYGAVAAPNKKVVPRQVDYSGATSSGALFGKSLSDTKSVTDGVTRATGAKPGGGQWTIVGGASEDVGDLPYQAAKNINYNEYAPGQATAMSNTGVMAGAYGDAAKGGVSIEGMTGVNPYAERNAQSVATQATQEAGAQAPEPEIQPPAPTETPVVAKQQNRQVEG